MCGGLSLVEAVFVAAVVLFVLLVCYFLVMC